MQQIARHNIFSMSSDEEFLKLYHHFSWIVWCSSKIDKAELLPTHGQKNDVFIQFMQCIESNPIELNSIKIPVKTEKK